MKYQVQYQLKKLLKIKLRILNHLRVAQMKIKHNKIKALDRQLSQEFDRFYEKHSTIPTFSPLTNNSKYNGYKRMNTALNKGK